MAIQIKLFGDLRKKGQQNMIHGGSPIILSINSSKIETVLDILKNLGIDENEVSHIFINGNYSGLKKKVNPNDLVALFPKNMGLLYKWYFKRDEDV